MNKRMLVILIVGAVLCVGAWLYAHENQWVKVDKTYEVRCKSPLHDPEATLLTRTYEEDVAPRKRAKNDIVVTTMVVCEGCIAKAKEAKKAELARQEAERQAEILQQEKAADVGKLPPLLGKSFKEVVDLIGAPDSSPETATSFSWVYNDTPSGYRTSLDFIYHTPDFICVNTKKVQAIVTNIKNNQSQPAAWNIASGVVPMRILKKEPTWIYAYKGDNQLNIVWRDGKCVHTIIAHGDRNTELFNHSTKANVETGDVEDVYEYTGVDWKNLVVFQYRQYGPDAKYKLPTGGGYFRVK